MLKIEHLQAWYGTTQALFDVSFDLNQGETLALVGVNGAGKTTVVRSIAGLLRTRGQMVLDGVRLDRLDAHRRVRDHGLAVVHEGRGLFATMTVRENLLVGNTKASQHSIDRAVDLFPALATRLDERVTDLSGGQQQMVALGRAILRDPRLLLLDEPSLGLAPIVIDEIYAFLGKLRETGLTMLLVEQSIPLARRVSDRLCLLRTGATQLVARADDDAAVNLLVAAAFGSVGDGRNSMTAEPA